MKTLINKLLLLVLSLLSIYTPANAMWRSGGQRLARAVTPALQEARSILATKMAQAGKTLRTTPLVKNSVRAFENLVNKGQKFAPAFEQLGKSAAAKAPALWSFGVTGFTAGALAYSMAQNMAQNGKLPSVITELPKNTSAFSFPEELTVEKLNENSSTLIEQYKDNPKALTALIEFVLQNFASVSWYTLRNIQERFPEEAMKGVIEKFFAAATQQIAKIDYGTVSWLVCNFPELAVEELVDAAAKQITEVDPGIIKGLIEKSNRSTYATQKFTVAALANCAEIPSTTLLMLFKKNDSTQFQSELKEALAKAIEKLQKTDRVNFLEKYFLYEELFKETPSIALPADLCITEKHLVYTKAASLRQRQELELCGQGLLYSTPSLRRIVNSIIKKEKELSKQGCYTFVHGQCWKYLLHERIFTDLWTAHNGKQAKNFLFAHVRNRDDKKTEELTRQELMQNGGHDDKALLFLNAPFFGWTSNMRAGESSVGYFLDNKNANHVQFSLKDSFELHGASDIYEQHAEELTNLEKEYNNLCDSHGNMLLFAVPKKLAEKYVYLAQPYGYKKKLKINGQETDNIHTVMTALTNHPEQVDGGDNQIVDGGASQMIEVDQNEFCMVMSGETMDPASGIKVFPFNTVNEKKKQDFWKKYKRLFIKIENSIEEKQTSWCPPMLATFLQEPAWL